MKSVNDRNPNFFFCTLIRRQRWRSQLLALLLALTIIASTSALSVRAEELPSVWVQTSLNPAHPVVGQQVEFKVEIFVDTWFARTPQFPDLQVEDAIALSPSTASINLNRRIDGQLRAGQRRTYFLFPQLPGRYELPALSLIVTPARPGNVNPESVSLSTKPTDFLAQLPPELAAFTEAPILAIPQLKIETHLVGQKDSNSSQLLPLHTGDTLERTVTLQAADTLASMLPVIAVADLPGLSAYPDPLKPINHFERGQFTATRSDRIAYVADQPGRYQLPAQTIVWWNTRSQSLQTETIPAVDIRVVPTLQERLIQLLPWLIALLVLVCGFVYFKRSLQERWQSFCRRRQASELARWRYLSRACRSNDPRATWNGLLSWLASTHLFGGDASTDALLQRVDNPDLTQAILELETALFAPCNPEASRTDWSGLPLLSALASLRKRRRSQQHYEPATLLPPLNPTTSPSSQTLLSS